MTKIERQYNAILWRFKKALMNGVYSDLMVSVVYRNGGLALVKNPESAASLDGLREYEDYLKEPRVAYVDHRGNDFIGSIRKRGATLDDIALYLQETTGGLIVPENVREKLYRDGTATVGWEVLEEHTGWEFQ